MSSATAIMTEGDILSHAIESVGKNHWNQVARVFSELRLPDGDLDRVDALLEKNRSAAITDAERAELEKFLRVGNFLALLRARALRELGETRP